MGKDNDRGFKVITAFIKPGFRLRFSPTIIGAENIPKDGAVVIAGNHKNILNTMFNKYFYNMI